MMDEARRTMMDFLLFLPVVYDLQYPCVFGALLPVLVRLSFSVPEIFYSTCTMTFAAYLDAHDESISFCFRDVSLPAAAVFLQW
jgi:hypothetical protein